MRNQQYDLPDPRLLQTGPARPSSRSNAAPRTVASQYRQGYLVTSFDNVQLMGWALKVNKNSKNQRFVQYLCDGADDCQDGYDEDDRLCTAARRPPVEETARNNTKTSSARQGFMAQRQMTIIMLLNVFLLCNAKLLGLLL